MDFIVDDECLFFIIYFDFRSSLIWVLICSLSRNDVVSLNGL